MLSLVAYGNSDGSGSESEHEQSNEDVPAEGVLVPKGVLPNVESKSIVTCANIPFPKSENCLNAENKPTRSGSSSKEGSKPLYLPSSQTTSINFDLKILDKKRSQPIRITIPSLKELEKDEEPEKKPKFKPSTKGSGLFSLLPEPKNVTSSVSKVLMPQSVTNAKKPHSKKLVPQKAKTKKQKQTNLLDDDDGVGGEPLSSFFFSATDDLPLPPVDEIDLDVPMVPLDAANSISSNSNAISDLSENVGLDKRMQSKNDLLHPTSITDPNATSSLSYTSDVEEPALDKAALLKLCGARDRKKGPDLSEIIDVSGSTLVGDSSLQLAKELSKEQPTHSFKRKSECSSLQRRKHQITYLAEQAKAQELELRNNWAQNRMTRKQTQAKYGF